MCTMALRLTAYVATMTSNVPGTNGFREARSFVEDCHVEKTNKNTRSVLIKPTQLDTFPIRRSADKVFWRFLYFDSPGSNTGAWAS